MTWLKFRGSSVHHAVDWVGGGTYYTLCDLVFTYSERSENPEHAHGPRCYMCERKVNPPAQASLWEAA